MKVDFVVGHIAVAALSCSELSGPHQTVHATPVRSDETWTRSGSPHIVQGRIFISGGAILTIEAGATVLFDTLSELVFGRTLGTGTLRALGTAANPTHFAPGSTVLTVSNMRGYIAKMPAGEASAFPAGGAFVGNDSNEVRLALDTPSQLARHGAWVMDAEASAA